MKDHKNNNIGVENLKSGSNIDNVLDWMFEIDGSKKDIRKEPREFQEQAYYSGMIPFIPADYPKQEKGKEKFENNIRIVAFHP
ncbi:MAG: hypothetical protein JXA96_16870 [Sedimentisphaerales bacterium]|nr:hypothetical protein [Sedimentisphaerales bacterium]